MNLRSLPPCMERAEVVTRLRKQTFPWVGLPMGPVTRKRASCIWGRLRVCRSCISTHTLKRGVPHLGSFMRVPSCVATHMQEGVPHMRLLTSVPLVFSPLYFPTLKAEAIQAALDGKNVVVCTSTSSGKSLTYNVPVIQVCMPCCGFFSSLAELCLVSWLPIKDIEPFMHHEPHTQGYIYSPILLIPCRTSVLLLCPLRSPSTLHPSRVSFRRAMPYFFSIISVLFANRTTLGYYFDMGLHIHTRKMTHTHTHTYTHTHNFTHRPFWRTPDALHSTCSPPRHWRRYVYRKLTATRPSTVCYGAWLRDSPALKSLWPSLPMVSLE